MKLKKFSIMTIGALLLCAPLLAQTEEQEPFEDQPVAQEPAPESQESFEAEEPVASESEPAAETHAAESGETTDTELPRTASPLPLLALLGLGALGAAFGVRFARSSSR